MAPVNLNGTNYDRLAFGACEQISHPPPSAAAASGYLNREAADSRFQSSSPASAYSRLRVSGSFVTSTRPLPVALLQSKATAAPAVLNAS